jgi:choline monooxygenase
LVDTGTGQVPGFVCRYHGWAYALTGELRAARDFGEFDCENRRLAPVRVDTWRGLVFVNLQPSDDVPALRDALGTFADACDGFPMEDFRPAFDREHRLACNWKTYADNYLEGYHIPLVHPGLNKEIDAKRYEVVVDEEFKWVEQHAPPRDGSVIAGRWLWRWPNLALNLCPEGITIERYEPVDSRRTQLRYTYAFAEHDDENEILRLSDEVTREDIAICEAVQRNLDTGVYQEGWLSPRHETAVAAFQSWVRDSIS